ncbi:MAG: S-layer homology domain-containing protein [Actinomycetota bacterium]
MAGFRLLAALTTSTLVASTLALPAGALDRTSGDRSGFSLLAAGDEPVMRPTVSSDGRYVAFHSEQGFLIQGDTNGFSDVFVHDTVTDELELISRSERFQGNGGSSFADISGDGRFVAFHSQATVLVDGDTNQAWDVFLHDRDTGDTVRVSETAAGEAGDGASYFASVSDNGRYVAFHSEATNFSALDNDSLTDVYVKDLQTGALELISVSTGGDAGNGESHVPQISGDGRYVTFESAADDLVSADLNNKYDVFVFDRDTDTMERISVAADGFDTDDNSFLPQITRDGRHVAFESYATNVVVGDGNGVADVFVYDRIDDEMTRISTSFNGTVEPNDRALAMSISDDGQRVAFHSWAANLIGGDTNELVDVYLFTLGDSTPVRVSGGVTNANGASVWPVISGDGSRVVFESIATNLDADDGDTHWDAYTYDIGTTILNSITPTDAEIADNTWWIGNYPETGFTDIVPGAYYEEGVSFLKTNGITHGTGPSTYSPNRLVTRAEMVTFLFRMNGSQWPTEGSPFIDVAETDWFLEPVKWAYQFGITNGTSDVTFSPYAAVTRAQMAVFLWRLAGEPAETTPHGFVDVDPDTYYDDAVRWLRQSGITTGTSPDEYSPDGAVTRGQMAAFLERLVVTYGWSPSWQNPE